MGVSKVKWVYDGCRLGLAILEICVLEYAGF